MTRLASDPTKTAYFANKGLSLSYGGIGKRAIGKVGSAGVSSSIFMSQVGFCCAGLIFIEENVVDIMESLSNSAPWSTDPWMGIYIIAGLMPGLALLSWVRKLKRFSFTNILADIFILAGLLVVLYFAITKLAKEGVADKVQMFETFGNGPGFLVFAGTSVYMFEGIALVIPIKDAMEKKEDMPKLMTGCMIVITGFFLLFASTSYMAFGNETHDIIILNLDKSLWVTPTIQGLYILAMIFSYPLTLFPSIRILETLIIRKMCHTQGKWKKNFLRITLVLCTGIIAVTCKSQLSNVVSIIGSVCCVPLAFIYPALFHAMILRERNSMCVQALNYVIVAMGVLLMFGTTSVTIYVWIVPQN